MNTYQVFIEPYGECPRYEAETAQVTDGGSLILYVAGEIVEAWPAHAWRHMSMVEGSAVQ